MKPIACTIWALHIRWLQTCRMPPVAQRSNMLFVLATLSYRLANMFEQMNNAEYVEVNRQKTGHRIKEELIPNEKCVYRKRDRRRKWPIAPLFSPTPPSLRRYLGHLRRQMVIAGLLTGDVA